jgi:hypothetical protein
MLNLSHIKPLPEVRHGSVGRTHGVWDALGSGFVACCVFIVDMLCLYYPALDYYLHNAIGGLTFCAAGGELNVGACELGQLEDHRRARGRAGCLPGDNHVRRLSERVWEIGVAEVVSASVEVGEVMEGGIFWGRRREGGRQRVNWAASHWPRWPLDVWRI